MKTSTSLLLSLCAAACTAAAATPRNDSFEGTSASAAVSDDSAGSGGDPAPAPVGVDTSVIEPEADAPFENALDPDADPMPRWNVRMEWTGSRPVDSGASSTDAWIEIDRDWHLGDWTPGLQAGWTRSATGSDRTHTWKAGASLNRELPGSVTLQAAGDYSGVLSVPDDASGSIGASWDPEWGEHLGTDLSASGSWARQERGSVQAGLGISPNWSATGGHLGGRFDRSMQTYENAAGKLRSAYVDTWGWAARWEFRMGSWSTGPAWSGDWQKLNTSANEKIVTSEYRAKGKLPARKIPSSGTVVNQELLWNLGWSPLPVVGLSLDLFRTWGSRTLQARSGASPLEKATLARWAAQESLPQDSRGLRLSLSLLW